jgi:hypothetical protein
MRMRREWLQAKTLKDLKEYLRYEDSFFNMIRKTSIILII